MTPSSINYINNQLLGLKKPSLIVQVNPNKLYICGYFIRAINGIFCFFTSVINHSLDVREISGNIAYFVNLAFAIPTLTLATGDVPLLL